MKKSVHKSSAEEETTQKIKIKVMENNLYL